MASKKNVKRESKKSGYQIVMESREEIVKKFIMLLQDGSKCWQQEWVSNRPYNPVTGTTYKAGNFIRLSVAASEMGYTDPRWMTFKNVKDSGWILKPGSKSVLCEKWRLVEREKRLTDAKGNYIRDANGNYVTDPNEKEEHMVVNYFNLFNAECVEGIEPLDASEDTGYTLPEYVLQNSPVPVEDGEEPRYNPGPDTISLPKHFSTQEARYYSFYRALISSTGIRARMDRKYDTATETLICELGAVFLSADTHLKVWVENSAAYVQDWISILSEDYNLFFKASREADYAVGWINDVTGLEEALDKAC